MQILCALDTEYSSCARGRAVMGCRAMVPRLELQLPKSLTTIVEERIRDAIVDAELAFGETLREDGLGLSLGVSRTPMREALTRLQQQGLVVIVPKRGTFVFKPSAEDVEQLAAFRLLLETTGARLCLAQARHRTQADLEVAVAAMEAARSQGDGKAYARADTLFHERFFANCGNTYLVNAFNGIAWRIAALRAHLSVPRAAEQERSFAEHKQIIACFAENSRTMLTRVLNAHIMRSASVYAEALRS